MAEVPPDASVIAGRASKPVQVEAGKDYWWCACGRSKNQPFCDGSHRGTKFTPKKFTAEEAGTVNFCMCKQTKNGVRCDGTHRKLPEAAKTSKDIESTPEEPQLAFVKELARTGKTSGHGPIGAMGVPHPQLPRWDDIQLMVAQMATKPLAEDVDVGCELVLGPRAKKPLRFALPIFVSDMSYGALSEEAKTALAKGAELAGTGICSGEGGMLPEEQAANSRYLLELASAKFGWKEELVTKVQAFHFKGGQGAKTGTGGHLSANKVSEKIAAVRHLPAGQDAISPPTFTDLRTTDDFRALADRVRELSGGIPIGFKLSANHIEQDIDFALDAGADYIILDGRGGATGAAPLIFRDNISVPTIPALARARAHLDRRLGPGHERDVSLIITGGLRTPSDFVKALALGADGIAVANSALHAIGCVAARMCNTNQCPAGIATQDPALRKLVNIDTSAKQLDNFLRASLHLMKVLARACGHDHLNKFNINDLSTWHRDMAELAGVPYCGVGMRYAKDQPHK